MTLDQVIVMMNWVVLGIHQMASMVGGVMSITNVLGNKASCKARRGGQGKTRVQAQKHITAERQPGTDQRQGGAGRGRAGQARPEQGRMRQGRAGQRRAGRGRARHGTARKGVWFKSRQDMSPG